MTTQSTNAKIAQFTTDLDLAHQIVHGGPETVVQTEGGQVRSLSNVIHQLDAAVNDAAESVIGLVLSARDQAVNSSVQAQAQATTATTAANTATAKSGDATTSATKAAASQTSAATSATNAAASATTADTRATAAATSASGAATSAGSAQSSKAAAATSETNAGASAAAAAASATAAAGSASTANTSKDTAVANAASAANSATTATGAATIASNAATSAQGSADVALASKTAAETASSQAQSSAAVAVNGASTTATSTTSLAIGAGAKSLTLAQAGKAFTVGQWVYLADSAVPNSRWMHGTITAYNGVTGAMTVSVSRFAGTGSFAAWLVMPATPSYETITSDAAGNVNIAGSLTIGGKQAWHSGNLADLGQLANGPGYITSAGSITGNAATATSAAKLGGIPASSYALLDGPVFTSDVGLAPGDGRGLNFWGSTSYSISMGSAVEFHYGPVIDYSIKTSMDASPGRGFTWGGRGSAPIAALSNTGSMQIAGVMGAMAGFQNPSYVVNARNRIWSFGNADDYGLSYFQGTAGWSGRDSIGLHLGSTSAGASFNFTNNGKLVFPPNTTWGAQLIVGGDSVSGIGRTGTIASVVTSNGNLHLDSGSDKAIYLNFYSGTAGVNFGNGSSGTVASIDAVGNAGFNGYVTGNRLFSGYDSGVAQSMSCSNWFRTTSNTGIYFADFGLGLYAAQGEYGSVGTYGGKNTWGGYSINGGVVFMHSNSSSGTWGIYNDYINNWILNGDMNGNVTFTGNVTAYSDERLKMDWRDLPDDFIERVAGMRMGTYARTDIGGRHAGASAQEWQCLLPEVVQEAQRGAEEDDGTYLTLAYGNAGLVTSMALARRVIALEARLNKLGVA